MQDNLSFPLICPYWDMRRYCFLRYSYTLSCNFFFVFGSGSLVHCFPALWALVKLGLIYLVTFESIVFRSLRQSIFMVQLKANASIPFQESYINDGLVHDVYTFMRHIANYFCVKFFRQRKLLST